ncbi:peptidylprolyl isomerase [Mangrovivirga cuniculi]|nr:peptidylprolyl isomerase [Mangrovivirga cuniculi]
MRINLFSLLILFTFLLSNSEITAQKKKKKDELVRMHTPYGEMLILLYDDTPLHKENFLKLVKEGFYDSTTFHRVINDFMIQGGDPNSKDSIKGNDGSGGPRYTIESEFEAGHKHFKGALAAARKGDRANPERASSGSQFYIVEGQKVDSLQLIKLETDKNMKNLFRIMSEVAKEPGADTLAIKYQEYRDAGDYAAFEEWLLSIKPALLEYSDKYYEVDYSELDIKRYQEFGGAPHLDGEYTVFGRVIDGLEVIDKISEVKTNYSDRPETDIKIAVEVEEWKRKKLIKEYGDIYN